MKKNNANKIQMILPLSIVGIAVIVGIIWLTSPASHPDPYLDDDATEYSGPRIVLTVEEAEAYIGKTLESFCAEYGNAVNAYPDILHYFSESGGGRRIRCNLAEFRYLYDSYIVVSAYYWYDEYSKEKYDKNQEECQNQTDKCNDAPPVYIDAIPIKDAIKEGFIKE